MIPEHLAQALTGQFSSDPQRRALEIVERVQEWTGQSAEVETIDWGLQIVSVAGVAVAHSPVDTPAVLKTNIEHAIAARALSSGAPK